MHKPEGYGSQGDPETFLEACGPVSCLNKVLWHLLQYTLLASVTAWPSWLCSSVLCSTCNNWTCCVWEACQSFFRWESKSLKYVFDISCFGQLVSPCAFLLGHASSSFVRILISICWRVLRAAVANGGAIDCDITTWVANFKPTDNL